MIYIIMCAGQGKRWNNYLGVPKHLIEINGETLLGRTTRLLKENNINNYIITGSNDKYKKYGKLIPQTYNDCEVDRFEDIGENEICYLYGDVYYTPQAIKTIINTDANDILFFGSEDEIFAIKVKNKELFMKNKQIVKQKYLNNEIDRCIGWEVYRYTNNIPFKEHKITNRYVKIIDATDDIDYPEDYERFIKKRSNL